MKLSEGLRRGMELKQKLLHPYCAAVIVAAGTSSRMGGTNKILTVLENLPVIFLFCPSRAHTHRGTGYYTTAAGRFPALSFRPSRARNQLATISRSSMGNCTPFIS